MLKGPGQEGFVCRGRAAFSKSGSHMSNKSRPQRFRGDQLIAWYKWEFPGGDAKYREDYEKIIREFELWFLDHEYWFDESTEPWTRITSGTLPRPLLQRRKLFVSGGRHAISFHRIGLSRSLECTITSPDGYYCCQLIVPKTKRARVSICRTCTWLTKVLSGA